MYKRQVLKKPLDDLAVGTVIKGKAAVSVNGKEMCIRDRYDRMIYLSSSSSGGNTRTNAVMSVVDERSRPP